MVTMVIGVVAALDWKPVNKFRLESYMAETPFGTYFIDRNPSVSFYVLRYNGTQLVDAVGNLKMTLDTAKRVAYDYHVNQILNMFEEPNDNL